MRIPGMHYQDEIWTSIKKALGESAIVAFQSVGVHKLTNSVQWKSFAKPLEDALLVCLTPYETRLRREVNRHDVDAYTLAQDLVVMLRASPVVPFIPLVQEEWPPKYLARLVGQLAGVGAPVTDAKLRKVANNVFTELRDAVDVDGLKVACGAEITINRLFHLRLVDEQRQAMLKFLSAWQGHARLASMVVGEVLNPPLPSLSIRRALRDRTFPAKWLMNWDEHFVHIQTELSEHHSSLKGAAGQLEKLKRPLSSKGPKKFTFTEDAIDSLLRQLADYEWVISSVGGTGADVTWHGGVGGHVVDDKPDQGCVNEAPEKAEDNSADEPSQTKDEEEDEEDEGSGSLMDDVASMTVGELVQSDDDVAEGDDLVAIPPGKDTSDAEDDGSDSDPSAGNALTIQCLRRFPLPIQVAVLRYLTPEGVQWKEEFMTTMRAMGVFQKYGWSADYNTLTDAKLARQMSPDAVNVKVFQEKVRDAIAAFARCAEKVLESEHKARNSNS